MKTRDIVVGGLLAAIAIMIPLLFANPPLMVHIPPFQLPLLLMFQYCCQWPLACGGCVWALSPVSGLSASHCGARALMHAVFGGLGAYAYSKKNLLYYTSVDSAASWIA